MRDVNARNHLEYICSAYFSDEDSDGHFNCTEESIIDLEIYESARFIFSAASVMRHSYYNVETNMLPFLYSFLCFPRAGLTLRKILPSTLWLPLPIYYDNKLHLVN